VVTALPTASLLAVATACVFGARFLAARIFASHELGLGGLSRHDLLTVGLALLGTSSVAAGVPGLLPFVGRAAW